MRRDSTKGLARLKKAIGMAFSSRQYFGYALRLAAGCLTRAGRERFRRQLLGLSLSPPGGVDYPRWREGRLAARHSRYRPSSAAGVFAFLTTVYDTKGRYILELYESVIRQSVKDFEWVLLDNGSSKPDTLAAIATVRRDPRVVYLRVEKNVGILGGIRLCLERARARYVVPLDSDDLLTPDALAILHRHIVDAGGADAGGPPLLFTDEDKVRDSGPPFEAYHKPDWDPVLFWNSCYIAHLCAVRRDLALQLGVYSDDGARGCHDWDTFFRFLLAGESPVHVPEVTYSWRLHPESCAGNIFSKSYIHESHRHVLTRSLGQTAGGRRFSLEPSPLFDGTPDWWVRRQHVDPVPLWGLFVRAEGSDAPVPEWLHAHPLVSGVVVAEAGRLASARDELRHLECDDALVVVVHEGCMPEGDEWPWELMGLFERFPDTSVVGGRLLDGDRTVWSAGEVAGFGGGVVGAPDRGRHPLDPGYFAWMRKQRSVTAVHAAFCCVRARALLSLWSGEGNVPFALLGAWLGGLAREQRQRVVFTPMVDVTCEVPLAPSESIEPVEGARLLARFPDFLRGEAYYPRCFGLDAASAFSVVTAEAREEMLADVESRCSMPRASQASHPGRQIVA